MAYLWKLVAMKKRTGARLSGLLCSGEHGSKRRELAGIPAKAGGARVDGRGSRPAATSLPAPRGRMYLIQAEIKPTASGDAGPHRFPAVEIELAGGSASPALSLCARPLGPGRAPLLSQQRWHVPSAKSSSNVSPPPLSRHRLSTAKFIRPAESRESSPLHPHLISTACQRALPNVTPRPGVTLAHLPLRATPLALTPSSSPTALCPSQSWLHDTASAKHLIEASARRSHRQREPSATPQH